MAAADTGVKSAFDRGACAYDAVVDVQMRVVEAMALRLSQEHPPPRSILDVGCGTGTLLSRLHALFPEARLTGIDISHGMLSEASRKLSSSRCSLVNGDAGSLPFAENSFDLVVSTSVYQWVPDLGQAFSEVLRVLSPRGLFSFTLFGGDTLRELRDAYRSAEGATPGAGRTRTFRTKEEVASALAGSGFAIGALGTTTEQERYPDVPSLLRAIRGIGAGTAATPVRRGLGERGVMRRMMELYTQRYGSGGFVPATYEVIAAEARKPWPERGR